MGSIDVARENVEAFNAGDWERFRATLADSCVYDEPGTQRHLEGQDAIIEANMGWREAFPDARGRIDNALEAGGKAVLEITWEGTQSGPLHTPEGDIAPSNKRATIQACEVFTLEGDKIKESHHYFDMMGMLQQLGVEQQAGAAR